MVYTKPWVVDLILDLAGYTTEKDLTAAIAIEPAAGEGAFLIAMARRLIESCQRRNRPPLDCKDALIAYELRNESAAIAHAAVVREMLGQGITKSDAETLAASWVRVGDYLCKSSTLPATNFIIGNPPYIRLEDIQSDRASMYRSMYSTMIGRADIYVAFFEAALKQLADNGVCAFICADRWMLNQYGTGLRRLITSRFGVESVIEMHHADAFLAEVNAYPAITVIRKAKQGSVIVASIERSAEEANGYLATTLCSVGKGLWPKLPKGIMAELVPTWFAGQEPWPCASPKRLAILKHIEEKFPLLESEETQTKIGIGVATGADKIFITKDAELVEPSRLLPLAMAADISSGNLSWDGYFLVNPWDEDGLVDLEKYPRLKAYFENHATSLKKRHVAQKNTRSWYRTIDRVNIPLTNKPKLYITDIKDQLTPVLDMGTTYPHHNLYFVQSQVWNLEVLGGLLLSDFGQFFVESYGVRMRGGYFRFQAQYLRRIHVPRPTDVSNAQSKALIQAFRNRDRVVATKIALKIYGVESLQIGG